MTLDADAMLAPNDSDEDDSRSSMKARVDARRHQARLLHTEAQRGGQT